jgi:hypothetical protein
MRVATVLSCIFALALSGTAVAADNDRGPPSPPFYKSVESRFAVIFPGQPVVKNTTYTNGNGAPVPAKQYVLEQGPNKHIVTVADYTKGPAADPAIVERAVQQLRDRGKLLYESAEAYEEGIPSRQVSVSERNGNSLRASVYMWDHRLFIVEASGTPGTSSLLRFQQSVTLLNPDGGELNFGRPAVERR